ncbi:hypothetical protein [Pseudoduganella umbonata]|uniref:Uncharacterized protein n=1 Tax=Pseudoduganella umbonata TaxID=864828 RepID=A0A7W5HBN8_9BURK|nr:hypothetical protein [Pseudoduganella umbonata]MBB3221172.1 hypothetical protein [Pseudoduganella umbonata]
MHDRTSNRVTAWRAGQPGRARVWARACAAALLAVAGTGVHAGEAAVRVDAGGDAPREFAVRAEPAALPALALPAVQAPATGALSDERLAQLRGGTDTPWSDMKLGGTVGNNAASNVVTGSNIITDGAFSNASGLPMVIQNSGANVLIQNATIVNVQFK